jgi:hypothetical protein
MRKGRRVSTSAVTQRLRGQHMSATARYAAQAAFLAAHSVGDVSWSVRSTCRVTGLGKSTVYRWAASDHLFAEQLKAVRALPLPVPVPPAPTLTATQELLLSLGPEPSSAEMALLADEINASIPLVEVAVEEVAPPRALLTQLEQEDHLTAAGEQLLAYLRSLA